MCEKSMGEEAYEDAIVASLDKDPDDTCRLSPVGVLRFCIIHEAPWPRGNTRCLGVQDD